MKGRGDCVEILCGISVSNGGTKAPEMFMEGT